MPTKNVDIKSSSFRITHGSPGHVTYGIWINGAKSGELTVRTEEAEALGTMLVRAGMTYVKASEATG